MECGDTDVGFLLKQISNAMGRRANHGLKDVTISQLRVMIFLAKQPPLTCFQRDVERSFNVSHPTVTGLIKRLEAKGYVQVCPGRQDRRCKELQLTAEGEAMLQQAAAHRAAMERQLCRGLSAEEMAQLRRMLGRLYQNALEGAASQTAQGGGDEWIK